MYQDENVLDSLEQGESNNENLESKESENMNLQISIINMNLNEQ